MASARALKWKYSWCILVTARKLNGILLSHKKNEIMPFAATWMELEIIILSEVSQTEKGKYHIISLICGIYKNDTNELIYRTEVDSQT